MSSLADMQRQVTEMQRTLQPTEQQTDTQQQLTEIQRTLARMEQQVRALHSFPDRPACRSGRK
jgi:hypothetical protein